jgi:photosynthetic reaction center cytochrome c subunit
MAHALRRAGNEPDGTVNANGTKITIHSSPTGYWQTWENAGDRTDYRVDYVIGSGEHASGYLVNLGGHLFQSPIAYYKSRQSYDLAPGYETVPDPDFTRPVSEECVLCHSGTALHVPGTLNEYRSPPFPAEGITCERCHGPAERHLQDPRAGTIVNPAKLQPAARDSICEQCHLFGVARVPNPGKKVSDFIPGQPLENTFTIYRNAAPEGSSAGSFKVISHVEQLALSACARKSEGRLWCATCHNPHEKMSQSLDYYRARCLSCHVASFPASHPPKDSDCLACHMPRRDAKDGGHTAFTDHRIQRRPVAQSDLPADAGIAAWREPSPDLRSRNLGIAYIDVGMQRHSAPFIIQGYRILTDVQQQFVNDPDFFKWIGEALLVGKQSSDAKLAFERALQLDPGSALTESSAASPYILEGDSDRAITHLERAVTLDPLDLPAASTLVGLYQRQGKLTEAAELSAKIQAAMRQSSGSGQTARDKSTNASRKTADEVFKNIQVLKGVASDQLIPSMEFISSALGVECSFCHVDGHFEKDEKKPKQTAREMMRMMLSLNGSTFGGNREVTCYSCHRGKRDPVATPTLTRQMQPIPEAASSRGLELPGNLPTASQLLENYIAALGGAATIEKITSRVERGSTNDRGRTISVEVFTQAPERQAVVRYLPEGQSAAAFDGHSGWIAIPGRPPREMLGAELEAMRLDADLQFPLHIQQMFPELRVEFPEKIAGREVFVLFAIRQGQAPVKLYFDEQSSLLVRLVRYVDSPLGLNPQQIDYADYREVDGVQVPFRMTFSQPGNSSTIQFEDVRQNVPVDPTRFSKPPTDGSPAS